MKYQELFETLNNAYPIEWKQKNENGWYGLFMADDEEYSISVEYTESYYINEPNDSRWFELAFGITRDGFSDTKVIDTKNNQFKIFATVVNGLTEAVDALKPTYILFSAFKGNRSRIPLYDRMIRKMTPFIEKLGYSESPLPNNVYIDMTDIIDEYKTYSYARA